MDVIIFIVLMSTIFVLMVHCICFGIAAMASPACAEDIPSHTMYVCVSEGSTLNVRSTPETDGFREGYLQRGDEVEVYSISDGWAAIDFGKNLFYCSSSYLSDNPPSDRVPYMVSSSGRVRVRDVPDGQFVRWVNPGDEVIVVGWQTIGSVQWAILTDGSIMAEYLSDK